MLQQLLPLFVSPSQTQPVELTSALPVTLTLTTAKRQATGKRNPAGFELIIPKRWSVKQRMEAAQSLLKRLERQEVQRTKLVKDALSNQTLLELETQEALESYVKELNAATLQSPLRGVRQGWAKHSRMAQVNLRTGVMTVSKYCLGNVPEQAFRYLLIHELAHFYVAGHGPRFWAKVAEHCPDYKRQHKIIGAWHQQVVLELESTYLPWPT